MERSDFTEKKCPNGVEYKKISEVATIERGKRVVKEQLSQDEGYPVYQNSLISMGYHTDFNYEGGTTYVIGAGAAGEIGYSNERFWAADDCFPIKCSEKVLDRYIYHILLQRQPQIKAKVRKASIPRISRDVIGNLLIPVPSIDVQREIVQILDKFMLLSAELSTELSAELSNRKKQYDYYGNQLFESISDDVNVSTVGEIITSLKTGLNPRKNFTLNEAGASYPYITGKDIFDNQINVTERTDRITPEALELINKRAHLEKGLLLFASTGTGTVGRMAIIEEYNDDWGMSETLYGIKVDEKVILPHYLMFFLYSVAARKQFEPKITKGSVPHLKVKDLLDVKIPVPSIEVQTKIVDVLSRFDKLCNGMMEELLAEIEARQKQYEYYRDKLLTFKEAV